ncbi:MAG: zinc-dependent metalloprotease, partial [Planctomycetota bacterium JB042]
MPRRDDTVRHLCPTLRAVLCVLATAAGAIADPSPQQRFPMDRQPDGTYRMDAARFEALRERASVLMDGVPLPGEGEVTLHLRRMRVAADGAKLSIDGEVRPLAEVADHLQIFRGTVVGDEDSHAFLAFSPEGSRGYVRRAGRTHHLRSARAADAEPASSFLSLEGEGDLMGAIACGSGDIQQFLSIDPSSLTEPSISGMETAASTTTYECEVGVETDFEFYEQFDDETDATNYALTLMGAVSDIYLNDVNTIVTVAYLGIHTSSSDGWNKNDGTIDRLYAFRDAWKNGNAPVSADLYHFLSGVNMGGGVAWVNALCSQSYGFGVSANIDGGLTVPVTGTAPWDLVVVAHEMGHNFVSPHTHAYCPPVDECAPSAYWENCQDEQICIPNGTIMSYCHLCPGGLSNIDLNFHATVAAAIRAAVESSCLDPIVLEPELCVDQPDGVHVTVDPSVTVLGSVEFGLANCGTLTDPVDYTATKPGAETWFSASPATGTVGVSASTVAVNVDVTGLDYGLHTAVLHLENDDDAGDFVDLPVSVMVLPPPFRPGD